MIRVVLVAIAAIFLLGASVSYLVHLPRLLTGYLTAAGIVPMLGLAIERSRYHPDSEAGDWEPTGERFIDPGSGHLVEVLYNPQSGERLYRDLGAASPDS